VEEIEKLARQTGMVTLFEHGCMAVEQGHTTLGELVQMLGESDGG
jgi:protein transport protein HofB